MSVLTIDSLSFAYGDKRVLSGVYLETRTDACVALLGRNGCGKSTLFWILAGWSGGGTGTVRVDGAFVSPRERARHIALLPQEAFLPRSMKTERAVRLFCKDTACREKVLEDERVREYRTRRVVDLSGGERRWLEFLLVLSLERPFVLLDEPYNKIEPIWQERMNALILRKRAGTGFIVTDHSYWMLSRAATRVYVMRDGSVYETENSPEALARAGYVPERL